MAILSVDDVLGSEAAGGLLIALGLAVAPLYIAIAFPIRARRLIDQHKFSGYEFRKGQTVFLVATCFLLSMVSVLLVGGAFDLEGLAAALSMTVLLFFMSAFICFPLVFLWLWLAR